MRIEIRLAVMSLIVTSFCGTSFRADAKKNEKAPVSRTGRMRFWPMKIISFALSSCAHRATRILVPASAAISDAVFRVATGPGYRREVRGPRMQCVFHTINCGPLVHLLFWLDDSGASPRACSHIMSIPTNSTAAANETLKLPVLPPSPCIRKSMLTRPPNDKCATSSSSIPRGNEQHGLKSVCAIGHMLVFFRIA